MGILLKSISKSLGNPPQKILKDISFEIADGEYVSLTGRSGSGKSTLLYVMSDLDRVSEGHVVIDGKDTTNMKHEEIHEFRNRMMGFIFQFHYLLSELTGLENVLMPTYKFKENLIRRKRAQELLEMVGLGSRMHHLPREMSGGEQQRVAIARSLIMNPKYLFADEPTGALDTVNAEAVIDLLEKFNREEKTTVIMVTHDPDFAERARRKIVLSDGRLIRDSSKEF